MYNISTRQDRLVEVYDHLRRYGYIHTKKDLARSICHTLPAMYSAFSGNKAYLTDNFFKKICDAFPDTFNLKYLLIGEGELLIHHDTIPPTTNQKEQSEKDIISLATDLIVELEQLRRQTQNELMQLAQARQSLESATAQLQKLLTSHRPTDYFPQIAAESTTQISTPNTPKNP